MTLTTEFPQDIAKKRQLAIIDAEEDATHVVHPVAEADDESYARAVFKRGEKCLVHFYRFPESRDNWGVIYPPEDKEPPEFGEEPYREEQVGPSRNLEPSCAGGKFEITFLQYQVSADWLFDMEEYNEFMCEEDYAVDEDGEPQASVSEKNKE